MSLSLENLSKKWDKFFTALQTDHYDQIANDTLSKTQYHKQYLVLSLFTMSDLFEICASAYWYISVDIFAAKKHFKPPNLWNSQNLRDYFGIWWFFRECSLTIRVLIASCVICFPQTVAKQSLLRRLIARSSINLLSPHDALKHHFTSLKTDNFPTTKGFRMNISMKLDIYFLNNIKSSSSTTSRELRQQFAACSGWRWQW